MDILDVVNSLRDPDPRQYGYESYPSVFKNAWNDCLDAVLREFSTGE